MPLRAESWKTHCSLTQPLPAFAYIRPEHVEPAMREVLAASRARIDELAAVGDPTFAAVVEPLEELQHRISRVWSPVSHLNAVLNSEALRASYNACLPLLSAYQTDLAQSEPLYRAYEAHREARRPGARPGRAARRRARAARLPPRRRRPRRGAQAPLQGRDARADAAAGEVRRERARCHQRLDASRHGRASTCAA